MNIGSRTLGPQCPTFIICEVGSNWSTIDDCVKSIELAALAGADAVKFQHFTTSELYGQPVGSNPHYLPEKWFPRLKEACGLSGVEFMCSAFSPEGYGRVDPFVNAHKVASCEAIAPPIVDAALACGKPTFISVGAMEEGEIREMMERHRLSQIMPMFCVGSYPAVDTPWHLFFGMPCCISDHSLEVYPPVSPGCFAIEKHVNLVGASGPDAPHSLNFEHFKAMCGYLRGKETDWHPHPDILKHRRRLVTLPDGTQGWFRPLPEPADG